MAVLNSVTILPPISINARVSLSTVRLGFFLLQQTDPSLMNSSTFFPKIQWWSANQHGFGIIMLLNTTNRTLFCFYARGMSLPLACLHVDFDPLLSARREHLSLIGVQLQLEGLPPTSNLALSFLHVFICTQVMEAEGYSQSGYCWFLTMEYFRQASFW